MTDDMADDIRYLRKWLNEENTAPIDRRALACVLAYVFKLEADVHKLQREQFEDTWIRKIQ